MKKGPALVLFHGKINKNVFIGPCFLGLLLYVSGLMVFSYEGLGVFYLKQWWIPSIIGGISWVSLALTWGFSNHKKVYSEALTSFNIEHALAKKILKSFFSQIYDDPKIFCASIPWAITATAYIMLARNGTIPVPQDIVVNILSHVSLLAYSIALGCIAAYHVGMGSYMVVRHTLFVRDISRFSLRTTPLEIRHGTALQGLGRFSFLASITWFVDWGMSIFVMRSVLSIVTISILIVLTVFGLLLLLLPQIYLRRSILRYKNNIQSQIAERFRPRWKSLDENLGKLDLFILCELYDQVEGIEEWPFGKGRAIEETLASLIPLATSIIALVLRA